MSDDDFVRAALFLRHEFPGSALTVTTREPPHIRDLLIRHGANRVSAGVSTAPGGYADGTSHGTDAPCGAREQFQVTDERSAAELASVVRRAGLSLESR